MPKSSLPIKRNKVRFEGDKETERIPSPCYDEGKRNALLLRVKNMTVVCSSGVLFGGNANNSANAGLSYANTNNTATNTNANIGSQLY